MLAIRLPEYHMLGKYAVWYNKNLSKEAAGLLKQQQKWI